MIFNEAKVREKIKLTAIDEQVYRITKDKKGMPNVQFDSGKSKWFIHSSYDVVREGENIAHNEYSDKKVLVVFGIGLGYHVGALLKMLKPEQKLYLFETNLSLLKIAIENSDILEYLQNENITLYAGENLEVVLKYYFKCLYAGNSTFIYYKPVLNTVPVDYKAIKQYMTIYHLKESNYYRPVELGQIKKNFHYKPIINVKKYKIILLDCCRCHDAFESFTKNILIAFKYLGCEIRFMTFDEVNAALYSENYCADFELITSCNFFITIHLSFTMGDPLFDFLKIPIISIGFDQPYSIPKCIGTTQKYTIYTWPDKNILKHTGLYIKTGMHRFLPQCAELDYEPSEAFNRERFINVVIFCSGFSGFNDRDESLFVSECINKDDVKKVYKYYQEHCMHKNLEECVEDVLGISNDNETLLRFMGEKGYAVLAMVSRKKRHRVLKALLDGGINIHLFGGGWENTDIINHPLCIYHDCIFFESMQKIFEYSKILVNIMPSYNMNSTHEKIYSSMSHGALCITDATDYLRESFSENDEIVFYDNDDLAGLTDMIRYYLANEDERLRITKNAATNIRENHTWINRAEEIIGFYEEFMNQSMV